jgi:23S rRNA (adenine2030-N6)-methyltransferase
MQYRHRFHAGSFADVHKHVTLLALIAALQRKDSGFLYLETHAGRGTYDLTRPGTEATRTAQNGLARLAAAAPATTELRHYLAQLALLRGEPGNTHAYPGSPLLVAAELRPQDRAVLLEIVPSEARALQRALRGYPRAHVEEANGFERLRAYLPPPERRGLVFIDPPYEERADFEHVAKCCQEALRRLRAAVVVAWYPLKDARTTSAWLARLAPLIGCDNVICEWWLYPRDSRVSLNGSGLLILNPPYQFAARLHLWLAELHAQFNTTAGGGMSIRTLSDAQ